MSQGLNDYKRIKALNFLKMNDMDPFFANLEKGKNIIPIMEFSM